MRGMNDMVRQAQMMQRKMTKTQEALKAMEVEGGAGGGMISVRANGSQEILEVVIKPEALAEGVEMLQDLVLSGVNDALKRSRELMEEEMSKVTGGFKIPGLF